MSLVGERLRGTTSLTPLATAAGSATRRSPELQMTLQQRLKADPPEEPVDDRQGAPTNGAKVANNGASKHP
jgi:hypothetical protein